jgi:hypothetical protein
MSLPLRPCEQHHDLYYHLLWGICVEWSLIENAEISMEVRRSDEYTVDSAQPLSTTQIPFTSALHIHSQPAIVHVLQNKIHGEIRLLF